jgi:transcriptional regulator with XRE-family HTH domain
MDIKTTIEKAGISVEEFGNLCGVSRAAVYTWIKGSPVDKLRVPKVQKLLDGIELGTTAGDFPLGEISSRKKGNKELRMTLIKTKLIKHLKQPAVST